MFASKRLGKELIKIQRGLPPGITLVKADDMKEWQLDLQVLDPNPLYLNQIFRLVFIFSNNYPIEPPEVTFLYVAPSPSTSTPTPPSTTNTTTTTSQSLLSAYTSYSPFRRSQPQPQPPNTSSQPIDLTTPDPQPPPPSIINTQSSQHRPIPIHPHIYSNGIICLDLLGTQGWSPVQSVESVCMSIQSMLTGNSRNERPEGDMDFVRSMGPRGRYGWSDRGGGGGGGGGAWGGGGMGRGRGLKDVRFAYDDDTV